MTNEINVTQNGKVMPETGSVLLITLGAKDTANTNTEGDVTNKYLVVRVNGEFTLVGLSGPVKGVATKTFRKIPQLVEMLNENVFVKEWLVSDED